MNQANRTERIRKRAAAKAAAAPKFEPNDTVIHQSNHGQPQRCTVLHRNPGDAAYWELTHRDDDGQLFRFVAHESLLRKARPTPAQVIENRTLRFNDDVDGFHAKNKRAVADLAAALAGCAADAGGAGAEGCLEWHAQGVALAGYQVRELGWLKRLDALPAGTCFGDYYKHLEVTRKQLERDILNGDSYRHNSTAEIDSLLNREKFRAKQECRKLLTQLLWIMDQILEAEAWAAAGLTEIPEGGSTVEMPSDW
jgi:hypothetical protein